MKKKIALLLAISMISIFSMQSFAFTPQPEPPGKAINKFVKPFSKVQISMPTL